MAVVGIPVREDEDGALGAVRAARELHKRLAHVGRATEEELGVALAIRTGVDTDEVVTGTALRLATPDAVAVAREEAAVELERTRALHEELV